MKRMTDSRLDVLRSMRERAELTYRVSSWIRVEPSGSSSRV